MRAVKPTTFSSEDLRQDILREAKIVGMPIGSAEAIAEQVAEQVSKWVKTRAAITTTDLNLRVALELTKFSPDLAYVYQNRGKII